MMFPLSRLRKLAREMLSAKSTVQRIEEQMVKVRAELDKGLILNARTLMAAWNPDGPMQPFSDYEFQVFSQFGDDGIIQRLIRGLKIEEQTFVEFGVQDYSESNTRFLLINNNWRGLILDCSEESMDQVRRSVLHWRQDLTVATAFIDRDNINSLLSDNGFSGELGILSVDIDGNDYWVWEAINVVNPMIVIAEYNAVFGPHTAVSIPYDPKFYRTDAHSSNLYWGCSLGALAHLAEKKGYAFVGCNSHGNNSYFVRKDRLGSLKPVTVEEGYVESKFRESRDESGKLSYLGGAARLKAIEQLPVVEVTSGRLGPLNEFLA